MSRLRRFAIVGASGVVVNLGVVAALATMLPAAAASAGGIAVSILTNFILNDAWTWGDRVDGGRAARFGRYVSVAGAAGVAQWVTALAALGALDRFGDRALLVAQLAGIAVGTVLNFVANDRWTFAVPAASVRRWPWILLLAGVLALTCFVQAWQLERNPMPPPSSHRSWQLVPRMLHYFQGWEHRRVSATSGPQLASAGTYYTIPVRKQIDWADPRVVARELAPGGRFAQLLGRCPLSYSTCMPHGYALPAAVAAIFPGKALLAALTPSFAFLALLAALYGIGTEAAGRPAGVAAAAIAAGYPGLFGIARWPEGYIFVTAWSTCMVWCLIRSRGLAWWPPLLLFCALAFTTIRTGEGFSEAAGGGLAVAGPFVVTLLAGLRDAWRERRLPLATFGGLVLVGGFLGVTTDWTWVQGSMFQMGQGIDEVAMAATPRDPNAGPVLRWLTWHGLYAFFIVNDYLRPVPVAFLLVATPLLYRAKHGWVLVSWFLVAFLGYSFMARKSIWYPIPMLPPLAAITAAGLASIRWPRVRAGALVLAGVLCLHQLVSMTIPGTFPLPAKLVRPVNPSAVKVRWIDLAQISAPDANALAMDARQLLRWLDQNVPPGDDLFYIAAMTPWGVDPTPAMRLGYFLTLNRPDVVVVELGVQRYVEGSPYDGLSTDRFGLLVCIGADGRFFDCRNAEKRGRNTGPAPFGRAVTTLLGRARGPLVGAPATLLLPHTALDALPVEEAGATTGVAPTALPPGTPPGMGPPGPPP